jgi:hypothetical protein
MKLFEKKSIIPVSVALSIVLHDFKIVKPHSVLVFMYTEDVTL